MKLAASASMLLWLFVIVPVANAADDSPFLTDKKEFKKQYKTIALAPVDGASMLEMPDSAGAIIEEEVTKHLEKRGYNVVPASVLGGIREAMEKQLGGFEDPRTGKLDSAKVKAVRSHALRELWFKHDLDAVATIRVSTTKVPIENDSAEWDGTKQKIERDGGSMKYTATVAVSSVSFAVYDHASRLLYIHYGGLESLMWRDGEQLMPLTPDRLFTDEKRIRKAAQIAIKPI